MISISQKVRSARAAPLNTSTIQKERAFLKCGVWSTRPPAEEIDVIK
jgi:hypothetical protein